MRRPDGHLLRNVNGNVKMDIIKNEKLVYQIQIPKQEHVVETFQTMQQQYHDTEHLLRNGAEQDIYQKVWIGHTERMNVDLNVIQTIIGMAKLVFQNLQEVEDDDEDEVDELPKITVQTETIHQVTMTEFVELLQKILRK